MTRPKVATVRSWLGKKVEWEYAHDWHRGTYLVQRGIVEDVKGLNVLISGDWRWLPSLTKIKLVGESEDSDPAPSYYISQLPDRKLTLKKLVDAKTCTKEQAVEYAILCAEEVLFIFEEKHPNDQRPRKAIAAARRWLANPTEANRHDAYAAYAAAYADADAAYAAADAADAADAAADAYAAHAA